nr:phosphopantetheine-binding protein [Bacillus velezensis]
MKLCALWEEVLKNGPVGIRDHFFERGGHSLKATALVSRIAKEFGVQVPLQDIFAPADGGRARFGYSGLGREPV